MKSISSTGWIVDPRRIPNWFFAHGDVEIFDLHEHPKAKRCYAWSHGELEEIITILELPPVDSVQSAVKVGVAYQIKKARK